VGHSNNNWQLAKSYKSESEILMQVKSYDYIPKCRRNLPTNRSKINKGEKNALEREVPNWVWSRDWYVLIGCLLQAFSADWFLAF
jgi:hypothetical protein